MKKIWRLVINTGYDWEETDELYFSKKQYAEQEAKNCNEKGYYIESVELKR